VGETISMALKSGTHLDETVYYALMGLAGLFTLAGAALFLKGMFKK